MKCLKRDLDQFVQVKNEKMEMTEKVNYGSTVDGEAIYYYYNMQRSKVKEGAVKLIIMYMLFAAKNCSRLKQQNILASLLM